MLIPVHYDAEIDNSGLMRTTVVIDSDVAAEVERLRREGMGLSEALNLLARVGDGQGAAARQLLSTSIGRRESV